MYEASGFYGSPDLHFDEQRITSRSLETDPYDDGITDNTLIMLCIFVL